MIQSEVPNWITFRESTRSHWIEIQLPRWFFFYYLLAAHGGWPLDLYSKATDLCLENCSNLRVHTHIYIYIANAKLHSCNLHPLT